MSTSHRCACTGTSRQLNSRHLHRVCRLPVNHEGEATADFMPAPFIRPSNGCYSVFQLDATFLTCALVLRPHLRVHCPEQFRLLSAVRMGCTFSGASSVPWKQLSVKLDTQAVPKKQAECTYLSVTEDSLRNALASFLLDASPCCLASLLAIPITCDHCVSVAMSSPMTTERQRCELEGSVKATAAHLLACRFGCVTLSRAFTSQNFACFFQKCSLSPLHHQQRQVSTRPSEDINISLSFCMAAREITEFTVMWQHRRSHSIALRHCA